MLYYTLKEAAEKLRISPDQLREMAKNNEIRAFQDRGNLRFRAPEIDELARARGVGSDVDLPLGDVLVPKSSTRLGGPKSAGPKSGGPKPAKSAPPPDDAAVNFDESDEIEIDAGPVSGTGKGTPHSGTGTRSPNPKPRRSSLHSPLPHSGDSDVRLVSDDGGLDFKVDPEGGSRAGAASPPPKPKSEARKRTSGVDLGKRKASRVELGQDSGARIVPLSDVPDSDVKIVEDGPPDSKVPLGKGKDATDSDVRVDERPSDSGRKRRDDAHVTEEIDLDVEALKAAEAARPPAAKPRPGKVGSSGQLPTHSPFELSEPDVGLPGTPRAKKSDKDSSSDFELKPASDGSSPLELGSDELSPLSLDDSGDDEEVGLGELTGKGPGASGINLRDPVDSGISLEGSDADQDFELSLEGEPTPKPGTREKDSSSDFDLDAAEDSSSSMDEVALPSVEGVAPEGDSSSEFELSLDESEAAAGEPESEFELSLDLEESGEIEKVEAASDSEFELTLDEGGLAPLDETAALAEEDKDIFETDFEVPALEDESGSQAVALDEVEEDLESSDFDLSVDEDGDTESESGSEVVVLDEEEGEVAEATPAPKPAKKKGRKTTLAADEEEEESFSDIDELGAEEEEADELEPAGAAPAAAAAPAPWGVIPALFLTPCVVLMILVCLMSFELMQGMWGYHKSTRVSSLLVDPLARFFDNDLPKE